VDIKALLPITVNTLVHPGVITKINNNMEIITHLITYLIGLLTGMYAAHKIEEYDNKKSNDE
tara:strand:+ start:292 stop:477 length:186 start_codon:yes stop_codon:yes gene_type:complete